MRIKGKVKAKVTLEIEVPYDKEFPMDKDMNLENRILDDVFNDEIEWFVEYCESSGSGTSVEVNRSATTVDDYELDDELEKCKREYDNDQLRMLEAESWL